jgi:hypothetical protein
MRNPRNNQAEAVRDVGRAIGHLKTDLRPSDRPNVTWPLASQYDFYRVIQFLHGAAMHLHPCEDQG